MRFAAFLIRLFFLLIPYSSVYVQAQVLNLIENPGFELHDRGELMFWAQSIRSDSGTRLASISPASSGPIAYSVSDSIAHTGEGSVAFTVPDPSMRSSLQYWRIVSDRQLELDQWKRATVHIRAWFHPEQPNALVAFRVAAFGDLPLGMHSEQMTLNSTGWQQVAFTIPSTEFGGKPLQQLDLQIFYVEGMGTLWCDDIEVWDELYISEIALNGRAVELSSDGYLVLEDGSRFVPQAIWGAGVYAPPTALRPLYVLLADLGFNTLYLTPSYFSNYATKRHLQVMLDVAYEAGLKAIVQIPMYPPTTDSCRFHREYIDEWVHTFRNHPALLAWYLLDASEYVCLQELLYGDGKGTTVKDWVHASEEGAYHPVLLATGGAVYSDAPSYTGFSGDTSFHVLADMASVADIVLPNVFPITETGNAPRSTVTLTHQIAVSATQAVQAMRMDSPRGVWGMVQTYPLTMEQKSRNVVPSAQQIEVMSAQSLLNGATGIVYYTAALCYQPDCLEAWSLPNDAPDLWHQFPGINERTRRLLGLITEQSPNAVSYRYVFGDEPSAGNPWLVDGILHTSMPEQAEFAEAFLTLGKSPSGESAILLRPRMELLREQLGGFPVGRAWLRLWLAERSGDTFGSIRAYEVMSPWDQTSVGWTNRPVLAAKPFAVAEIPSQPDALVQAGHWYLEWDITSLLHRWLADTSSTYGIYLRLDVPDGAAMVLQFPSAEYGQTSLFRDRRILPELVIDTADSGMPDLPLVSEERDDIESHVLGRDISGLTRIVAFSTDADESSREVDFYAPGFANSRLSVLDEGRSVQVDSFGHFSDTFGPYEVRVYSGGLTDAEIARRQSDITGDGVVDIFDLVEVGSHFGETIPPEWSDAINPDINGDGIVDILDLTQVAREFGSQFPMLAPVGHVGREFLTWQQQNGQHVLIAKEPLLALGLTVTSGTAIADLDLRFSVAPGLYWLPTIETRTGRQFMAVALGNRTIAPGAIISVDSQSPLQILGGVAVGRSRNLAAIPMLDAMSRALGSALGANFPNPCNPETWIPYRLAAETEVNIDILSITGKVIRRLALGCQLPGEYIAPGRAAHWDGRNDQGERAASGVYLYRLITPNFSAMGKMVVLK